MSASRPGAGRALLLQRVGGLVFLGVLAGLVGLSVAFYNKAFTDVVTVTLQADRLGNQLTAPADVKVNGVLVGEAREVRATPDGAEVVLALQPDKARTIPRNVQARLLPKTLFGEKFVDLVLPEQPSGQTLASGDVIPQDRTQTAREFGTALDDLLPVLETLDPETLSTTLNAVSTSLRGRGERLGTNLVLVRDYLREFNPELPRLEENLRGTADFADTITAAEPDLRALLDDLSAVNRNLVRDRAPLDRALRETRTTADSLNSFVRDNERRFVDLAREGRAPLELFARYSPEFPCLARSLAESDAFIGDSFGRLQPGLHITLEFTRDQGPYVPGDEPQYLEQAGPDCFGLPRPAVPAPDFNFRDGFRDDLARDTTQQSSSSAQAVNGRALVAPLLGVGAADVPDVAVSLLAPAVRGGAR